MSKSKSSVWKLDLRRKSNVPSKQERRKARNQLRAQLLALRNGHLETETAA